MQLQLTNKSPEQRLQIIREKGNCDIGEVPTYDRDFKERETLLSRHDWKIISIISVVGDLTWYGNQVVHTESKAVD